MIDREKSPSINNELPSYEINNSVEKAANFQGHDTELLFKRLSNPEIKNQIANIFEQGYKNYQKYCETLKPYSEGIYIDDEGKFVHKPQIQEYKPRPTRIITMELENRITQEESFTEISCKEDHEFAHMGTIPLNVTLPNNSNPNEKQMAIIETHEKGHAIRSYFGMNGFFDKYFVSGFDTTKISFTDSYNLTIKKYLEKIGYTIVDKTKTPNNQKENEKREFMKTMQNLLYDDKSSESKNTLTNEDVKNTALKGLFSGAEISERMSQLKNYFGFDGNQIFTKKHLNYARNNYIKETGIDNGMTEFFQAITLEKEKRFLFLINNSGI